MDQLMQVERPITSTSQEPYTVTYRDHVLSFWLVPAQCRSTQDMGWNVVFAEKGHQVRLDHPFRDRDEAHAAALDWIKRAIDCFVVRTDHAEQ